MKVISFLIEPAVIDKIVRHLEKHPRGEPFDARTPTAEGILEIAFDFPVL